MPGKSGYRGRWFRKYERILDDPKVWALDDADYRNWDLMLAIASRYDHDGRLPEMNMIAFGLRVSVTDAETVTERLMKRGLIDRVNGGVNGWCFKVHNWGDWQYKTKTSTPRVQEHRAKLRSVSETVSETPRAQSAESADFSLQRKIQKESFSFLEPETEAKPKPIDPTIDPKTGKPLTANQWHARLLVGRDKHAWPEEWGPMPGQPGCLVPFGAGVTNGGGVTTTMKFEEQDGRGWITWAEMLARQQDVREARGFSRNGSS